MALYEYQADDGERIEVHRSMRDEHPEALEQGGKVFRRVFGEGQNPIVKRYDIHHGHEALPVSVGMPFRDISEGAPGTLHGHPVVHFPDGGTTDERGRWIIGSKADRERAKAITGLREE